MSRAAVERTASSILCRHYPEVLETPLALDVADLIEYVMPEHFKVDYGVKEHLEPGVEGITVPRNRRGRPEMIFTQRVFEQLYADVGRARFTACHEVGHGILHAQQLGVEFIERRTAVLYRRQQLKAFEDPEWQSDELAAFLLMPTRAMMALVDRYGADPAHVQRTFLVSRTAAEKRLHRMRYWGQIS